MTPWRHLEHPSDIGVEGRGATLAEAFEQAALALTAVLTDPGGVRTVVPVHVRLTAPEADLLFVDWLDAVVYQMAARRLVFGRYEVRLDQAPHRLELTATLWGEAVDPARHAPAVEVKGVTFSGLFVGPEQGGFVARTVVDV